MNRLDVFYRALADYKSQTQDDNAIKSERKAIISENPQSDKINSVITSCTVDEEWVNAVEKGMEFIEKAISESRQHIHTQGEVKNIESVKRVSKDSVKHLAKHTDLIQREQDPDNIIPEKLYVVERLSDFAVYENKFLYMLLNYTEKFVSSKYYKIIELSNTYKSALNINKTIDANKSKTVFELKMTDERKEDPFLKQNNKLKPLLERMDNILKTVNHLAQSPLIQEVSKFPMIKPPITKTNVLKMNQNFKGAVVLYDYIMSYDKLGYSIETAEMQISPFTDEAAREFSEVIMLTSFLTYQHSLGITDILKSAYEEENALRAAEEELQRKERLAKFKNRVEELGFDCMEYALLLEKKNKDLLDESAEFEIAKQAEINAIIQKNADDVANLISAQQKELDAIAEQNIKEKNEIIRRHKEEVEAILLGHEQKVKAICDENKLQLDLRDNKILELESKITEQQAEFKRMTEEAEKAYLTNIDGLNSKHKEEVNKLQELNSQKNAECEDALAAKVLSDSRVNALRKEYNLIKNDDEFTSKVSFDELEHQYKVFKAFFKEEWKKAKKSIRNEILNTQNKKEESEDKTV